MTVEIENDPILSPLDDPQEWLRTPAYDPPMSADDIRRCQADIDSICGTTRDNRSIAKLVWNGDKRFWKERFNNWDMYGNPVGEPIRRPWLLYKSIFDGQGRLVRDAFVPRFMILTRIEPEQYAATWGTTSKIYCPERQKLIQFKPFEPPKDYYVWFMTVARHTDYCCQTAAENRTACYGHYIHPNACLEELRTVRKCIDAEGGDKARPFDSPDELARAIRENETNNYAEQAMERYLSTVSQLAIDNPLVLAPAALAESGASFAAIQKAAAETAKRSSDAYFRELKRKNLNQ